MAVRFIHYPGATVYPGAEAYPQGLRSSLASLSAAKVLAKIPFASSVVRRFAVKGPNS